MTTNSCEGPSCILYHVCTSGCFPEANNAEFDQTLKLKKMRHLLTERGGVNNGSLYAVG